MICTPGRHRSTPANQSIACITTSTGGRIVLRKMRRPEPGHEPIMRPPALRNRRAVGRQEHPTSPPALLPQLHRWCNRATADRRGPSSSFPGKTLRAAAGRYDDEQVKARLSCRLASRTQHLANLQANPLEKRIVTRVGAKRIEMLDSPDSSRINQGVFHDVGE